MLTMTKKLVGVGAAVVIAVGGAGVAYAVGGWFTAGSGHSTATAATVKPLGVTVEIDAMDSLSPDVSIPAKVTIDNGDNNFKVTVTSISPINIVTDDAHRSGCPGDTYIKFIQPASLPVIDKNAVSDVLIGQVHMVDDAPMACSGAWFTVNLEANARVGL